MAKRLAAERIARPDGMAQAAQGLPRASMQATLPLTEEPKPTLTILGARYLVSLANSGYPIEESLKRLKKNSEDEIVITKQALDELETACAQGTIGSRQLTDIKRAIWLGIVALEKMDVGKDERAEAHEALRVDPDDKDARPTESELSMLVLMQRMEDVYDILLVAHAVPAAPSDKALAAPAREPSVEDLRGFGDAQVMQVLGELGYEGKGGNGHWKMQHPVSGNTATIPKHREISPRTLNDILRQNEISRGAFLRAAQEAGLIDRKRAREIFGEAETKPGQKKDSAGAQPEQSA